MVRPVSEHKFAAEASDLLWPPGKWPERFQSKTSDGVQRTWLRNRPIWHGGEVVAYSYLSEDGAQLTVYND